jgi:hypothetical protein
MFDVSSLIDMFHEFIFQAKKVEVYIHAKGFFFQSIYIDFFCQFVCCLNLCFQIQLFL